MSYIACVHLALEAMVGGEAPRERPDRSRGRMCGEKVPAGNKHGASQLLSLCAPAK